MPLPWGQIQHFDCKSRNNRAMKKLVSPQDEYVKTAIRLPPELHAEVKRAAKAAGRPMNAELIARVASSQQVDLLKELLKQNAEMKAMIRELLDKD
jgi:hypothetical protein